MILRFGNLRRFAGLRIGLATLMLSISLLAAGGARAAVVREIRIEGQDKIGADAIRNRLHHPVESELNEKQVSEDLKAVHSMGYFETVEAWVEPDRSASEVTLIYRVKEKPTIRSLTIEGVEEFELDKIK